MQKLAFLVLSTICILLVGCNSNNPNKISTEEVNKIINDNDQNYIIVDVRTKDEYQTGHLKNAVNIPLDNIEDLKKAYPDLNTKIIVYCRSGNRSSKSSEVLKQLGYNNVYDMGGIMKWSYDLVIE